MGLQNKFGVLLIGVNLLLPTLATALVIDPVKVDSSRGEPLYAEIPFRYAESKTPIQVSIAQPFELGRPEVLDSNQFSHLNFYVRQNAQGNGVIVITSSRAINETDISLVLKISDGGQVRMQQVRAKLPSRIERLEANLKETKLQPKLIANEKDIQLNLPEASSIQTKTANSPNEQSLIVNNNAPPPLLKSSPTPVKANTQPVVINPTVVISTPSIDHTNSTSTSTTPFIVPRLNQQERPTPIQQQLAPEKITPAAPQFVVTAPVPPPPSPLALENEHHHTTTVTTRPKVPDQTLPHLDIQVTPRPAIAPQATTLPPAPAIAQQPIKQAIPQEKRTAPPASTINATAKPQTATSQHKVQANESLWKIAAGIANQQNIPIQQVMQQIQAQNAHAFVNGNANRLKQGTILNLSGSYQAVTPKAKTALPETAQTTKRANATEQEPTAQKQNQAHMSIVASNNTGAAQGTQDKGTGQSKQQHELTVQVTRQRNVTLALQNNVRKLDQQLKEKERRLAILNARLAELEQQLKNRQSTSPTSSNTTSRSQGVVPALIAGTLIAFAGLNSDFAIATLLQELV